jgi:PAS domain S-box-containing protein
MEHLAAQSKLSDPEERYRALFNALDEGFCIIEVLFNAVDGPFDYRFLETNPAFERHTGLKNAVGRRVSELVPAHEKHWWEIYGRVARSRKPVRFVNRAEALKRWFNVHAFPIGHPASNQVAVLFTDITEQRRSGEA